MLVLDLAVLGLDPEVLGLDPEVLELDTPMLRFWGGNVIPDPPSLN